jgi:hypothetical protein
VVEYDTNSDTFKDVDRNDSRISGFEIFPKPDAHTVFGDAYLLMEFSKKQGLIGVIKSVFQKNETTQRLLCHVLHGILKSLIISMWRRISKKYLLNNVVLLFRSSKDKTALSRTSTKRSCGSGWL